MKNIFEFAESTSDAYSYSRYGDGAWRQCHRMLRKRGYTDKQVESIMRSKWTRWAADHSGKEYGRVSSKDLERWLDICGGHNRPVTLNDVEQLTLETFNVKA
jgi:hypothetical protein